MTTLHRKWSTMLTIDNNANNNAATQMMGKDADDKDTAADVNATMKMTR